MDFFLMALLCANLTFGRPAEERLACNKASEAASIEIGLRKESKKLEKFASKTVKENLGKAVIVGLGIVYTYERTGKLSYTFKSDHISDLISAEAGKDEGRISFTWLF